MEDQKEMTNNGHWEVLLPPPSNAIGFIYLITNKLTNKKYIGRKEMTSNRRKMVKCKTDPTKKKATRQIKESDWRTYTGSSKSLNEDIANLGKQHFRFQILSFHTTKASLNYQEVYELITRGAMTKYFADGSPEYYNGLVPPVRHRP